MLPEPNADESKRDSVTETLVTLELLLPTQVHRLSNDSVTSGPMAAKDVPFKETLWHMNAFIWYL